MKYAYLVMLDWLTPDDHDTDYYLFNDYEKALDKFNSLIKDENDADISWVGSEVFDENGEVNEGFELSCNTDTYKGGECNLYWCVSENGKYRFAFLPFGVLLNAFSNCPTVLLLSLFSTVRRRRLNALSVWGIAIQCEPS